MEMNNMNSKWLTDRHTKETLKSSAEYFFLKKNKLQLGVYLIFTFGIKPY
jgi:hypothetical protein